MTRRSPQSGFTLIEMIVSLGVFSVVITIAVGALLILIANSKQLQKEQGVMTNLSFALDSMTREIRTGTKYYCVSAINYSQTGPKSVFKAGTDIDTNIGANATPPTLEYNDCWTGRGNGTAGNLHGIAFIEGGDSVSGSNDRILYFYDANQGKLFRKVGNGTPESIVSDGIYISNFDLTVTGGAPLRNAGFEDEQPTVTIYLEAKEKNDPTEKEYHVQTTITQRTLDI